MRRLRNDPTGKLKATTIIDWLAEQHPGRFSASRCAPCNDDCRIGGAAMGRMGRLLPPGASAGTGGPVRLHPLRGTQGDHRRTVLPPPAVPADTQPLGMALRARSLRDCWGSFWNLVGFGQRHVGPANCADLAGDAVDRQFLLYASLHAKRTAAAINTRDGSTVCRHLAKPPCTPALPGHDTPSSSGVEEGRQQPGGVVSDQHHVNCRCAVVPMCGSSGPTMPSSRRCVRWTPTGAEVYYKGHQVERMERHAWRGKPRQCPPRPALVRKLVPSATVRESCFPPCLQADLRRLRQWRSRCRVEYVSCTSTTMEPRWKAAVVARLRAAQSFDSETGGRDGRVQGMPEAPLRMMSALT